MITIQINTKPLYRGQPGGGITVVRGNYMHIVTRNAKEALMMAASLAELHQEVVRVIPGAGPGCELQTPDGRVKDYTPEEIAAAAALPDAPDPNAAPADLPADIGPVTTSENRDVQALADQFGKVVPAAPPEALRAEARAKLPADAVAPGEPGTPATNPNPVEASGASDAVTITASPAPSALQAETPTPDTEPQPIEWGAENTRTAGMVREVPTPGNSPGKWRHPTEAEEAAHESAKQTTASDI